MKTESPARRNVYISFDHSDLREVNLLRAQAINSQSNLAFIDRSIQMPLGTNKKTLIQQEIRRRLTNVSVTLVYVSDITHQSTWVEWEVRESINLNKGILAVHKGSQPPAKMPEWIDELGIKLLPWSQESLNQAIEEAAQFRN
jgi:hypothetical protein